MTTTTSPGWYPEPGQSGNGPAMERWWDGNAWTEYTRTAPTDAAAQAYPGYPGPGEYGYGSGDMNASQGGGGGRRPRGNVIIAIVAALVLIGGVVAGVLVLGKGSDSNDNANATGTPAPSATLPPGLQSPDPGQTLPGAPPQSPSDGTTAIDAYDGISLPVLDGWTGANGTQGIGASITIGTYACPGDATKDCVRGGAFAEPAEALSITATTAEAAAKADIAPNASESYSTDIYGATTSHTELESKAVTVAGQQGYMVRWKIVTTSGTDGYVESLAFPSPSDSTKLVVVRFGFDIGSQAPALTVMDQITSGIKADSSGGSSTGGSSAGTV